MLVIIDGCMPDDGTVREEIDESDKMIQDPIQANLRGILENERVSLAVYLEISLPP